MLRVAAVRIALLCASILGVTGCTETADLDPTPAPAEVAAASGGMFREGDGGFTGSGWSTHPGTKTAILESLYHAVGSGADAPDLTMVFYNPQHDPDLIVRALQNGPRKMGRLFGETTHEGILSSDGYHASETGTLGILSMKNPSLQIGVGGATFGEQTPREAAKQALDLAIADAGRSNLDSPRMIVLCVTLPHEEEVLDALAELTGPNIPLVGGTAAGSVDQISRQEVSNWSVIVDSQVIHNGLGVAVFYTDREFAWSYGGGYRRTSTSGIATKCRGRSILEIDGRPAVEVYDEWLGGRVLDRMSRGEDIADLCSFYPLATVEKTQGRFVRAWPSEDPNAPGSLRTGSTIAEGEEVFLSEGNWNILVNHFGSVPRLARASDTSCEPSAGLLLFCGGALAVIPDEGRNHMGPLVNATIGNIPWIGVFTWGEQGSIPDVGNFHSNLSAGTILFPKPGS